MTRAQVIDRLGKPEDEPNHIVMDYAPFAARNIIELFRGKTGRVTGFQLDLHGKKFKLADGNAVYAKGGLRRLLAHYGDRLHKNPVYQGQKSYSVYARRFRGRKVITTFLVTDFARSRGKVYEIDIDFRR
jgi:hypothetical protein